MNHDPLLGPKLKLARAKGHFAHFENTIVAFKETEPYEVTMELDPDTGESVYRIKVKRCLPPELSVIAGDVIHNLRSALDQMVCALVRANRKQVSSSNSFPVAGSKKAFGEACVGRLKNVSTRADRFIRRLKPYKGGNEAFWLLSELDNLDKHNSIVPVAIGQAQAHARIGLPFLSIGPNGEMAIGARPEGFVPFGRHRGWGHPGRLEALHCRGWLRILPAKPRA